MRRAAFAALLLAATAVPSLADDSSAMLGAGGIVLTKNVDIRMASEDLYLSPAQVKVHYTFVNDGPNDVDTIVAFPLPDVDNYEYSESAIGTTLDTAPNFVGFKLTIDGQPVQTSVEEHAVIDGRDVTDQVRAAHLPLNIVVTRGYEVLDKLSHAQRTALVKQGLIDADDTYVHAKWTTKTKFWWRMRFPAGKTVSVDHSYQPVTGQTFFTTYALKPDEYHDYAKQFCIDSGTRAAIEAGFAAIKQSSGEDGMFNQYTTEFVIKTANNWKGPIGRFHLTIDKLKPTNVLSMCWPGDLGKTGPTRFESTLTDFTPRQDIQILVLERPGPGQN